MFKILSSKEFKDLTESVTKYKDIAKYQKDQNKTIAENYNAIVAIAGRKSENALKTLICVALNEYKQKYPDSNIRAFFNHLSPKSSPVSFASKGSLT